MAKRTAVVLGFYVGWFVPNYYFGGYVSTESGETRALFGIKTPWVAVADSAIWMPYYGHCQIYKYSSGKVGLRADALGWFYCPLILATQKHVHPSVRYRGEDGFVTAQIRELVGLKPHPRFP